MIQYHQLLFINFFQHDYCRRIKPNQKVIVNLQYFTDDAKGIRQSSKLKLKKGCQLATLFK